ncbi:hypothetical protein LguiA_003917 [Lonicera macranthoides]
MRVLGLKPVLRVGSCIGEGSCLKTAKSQRNRMQAKEPGRIETWSPDGSFLLLPAEENKVMGDENKISIQNLEDTKRNEDTTNKNDIVDVESLKADAEINEVKQMPPSLITSTPAPNKPAKRRITPMAID